MTLSVTLLGTGSPMPSPDRAGPSTLISAGEGPDAEHYLVDAGRGVLMRLAAAGLGAPDLTAVLITHLHSDHITDLNDVITTRWIMTFVETPLTIVGPVGTQRVVDHILESLDPDIEYRIAHHEDLDHRPPVTVIEVTDGVVELPGSDDRQVVISCGQTDHKPVEPSVGFRFDHRSDRGRIGRRRRRHGALRGTRCSVRRCACRRSHRHPQGHHRERADAAHAGHARLSLVSRRGGADRGRAGRRHADPHALRTADAAERNRGRLARTRRRPLRWHDRTRRRPPPRRHPNPPIRSEHMR